MDTSHEIKNDNDNDNDVYDDDFHKLVVEGKKKVIDLVQQKKNIDQKIAQVQESKESNELEKLQKEQKEVGLSLAVLATTLQAPAAYV